ncbi:helix-turn-helix transcriptional regulator [Aureimonas endophytica]|uniref:Helix-turn-helix transcriptional regulator n=1 Tax=Aureimonas endophytica TaxID=2027858 RepID=A0A916ZG55_9HYPH|nr:response regulator transcription factor [Aureimonas endophytica]GGD95631.1 helix-turn-helix transcriptional regulator [Aureimonas endophytica]
MASMIDTSDVAASAVLGTVPMRRRTLLIIGDDEDCVSRNLLHAMALEFPGLRVSISSELEAAYQRFDPQLALILVDVALREDLREHAPAILRSQPGASLALFFSDERAVVDWPDVLGTPFVRSVLPMNLRLDVWLAAMRLILIGGDYLPFALLGAFASRAAGGAVLERSAPPPAPMLGPRPGFRDLTLREQQILELVARGRQNKLIAAALDLSEHTVKIHLHNIIRKLGVHNRTEAARLYLDGLAARPAARGGEGARPEPPLMP